MVLDKEIEKKVVDQADIKTIIKRLGKEVSKDYYDKYPILVGLLKGCMPFMGDFIKVLDFHLELGFMDVSSYHGGVQSHIDVRIEKDLSMPVRDRHILIVEDIVDSGRTLHAVIELLKQRGAKSVQVCTLLDKPSGRKIPYSPAYIGKEIPNLFVVGYGLDYQERFRNLPYVGVLKPEVYSEEDRILTNQSDT